MSEQIKSELKPNEITFMSRMESELLPNRAHVNAATMKEIGALVGISINSGCRTCAQKGGVDLLNLYGRLQPAYKEYLSQQIPITTHFEAVEEPILEDKSVIKKKTGK